MMPELPEVETIRRTLDPLLRGRQIERFHLYWPRTLAKPSLDEFRAAVEGRYISGVSRRAKLIIIGLDSGAAITIHLRMTGELLFAPDRRTAVDHARSAHLRAAFDLSGGAALLFYDVRKFGRITYLDPDALAELDREFGVEPLSDEFTAATLDALLRRHRRQIKPLLLDQRVIAGLGNIYVDEVLFRAYIHPLQRSDAIPADKVTALHRAIREVLLTAIEHQGTTLRNYRTGAGDEGGNQAFLLIYGKKPGTPCPRCGTPLQRIVVGQRGTIFCPNCQRLITPDTPSR
jgi:formamidopyrimidine-DNA glycosylase